MLIILVVNILAPFVIVEARPGGSVCQSEHWIGRLLVLVLVRALKVEVELDLVLLVLALEQKRN